MELQFYGATERVTGSCHVVRCAGKTILLDCGLIQGLAAEEALNREPFPFDPRDIDAVVLSHGHIDHSGRLPLLCRQGFSGPVFTQHATRDLALILLQDAARLEEYDVLRENRERRKRGGEPLEPLYTNDDVVEVINRMQTLPYDVRQEILPGIELRFQDAGHILGSAITELWLTENSETRKLVYSGDLGQYDSPVLNDPSCVSEADAVLVESTYGDRLHRERAETLREIGEIISSAARGGGNIIIPAFAIGRSQELLYLFGKYGDAWGLDEWQIYLDSPMAIEASRIYWDYPELYDSEARLMRDRLLEMPRPDNLHFTRRAEESKKINDIEQGAIIIAGSGMCNGGRILYHLKRHVERPESHVMITGYQAEGTLGRRLVEGNEAVEIHGRMYRVAAAVHTVGGLSAHGDQHDLLRWANGFDTRPAMYVVHGEDAPKRALAALLAESCGVRAEVPAPGEKVDLLASRNG
ncbi:MAG: MBL fold metallo-hydrolase [Prosthecochloris sp.]|nr:MBL fold metallo-hydrolase [Prosthecochloris sp.]